MAEFQEVMKQAKRMCKKNTDCDECPMCEIIGDAACPFLQGYMVKTGEIERIVMDWAKKHPELRYPTWTEWLREFSRAGVNLYDPIPADIAEKLGIKPMEESNG